MNPQDAYEITQMLQGVVNYGTGKAIRDYGITAPVAGKTGTTNSGEDVWFVGYTPTLVAGIWFGYDQPRQISTNASGGRLAAPAWAEMYQAGWHEPRGRGVRRAGGHGVGDRRSAERRAGDRVVSHATAAVVQAGQRAAGRNVICTPARRRARLRSTPTASRRNQGDNPITAIGKGIGNILRRIIRW